jgi:hypothetical protein
MKVFKDLKREFKDLQLENKQQKDLLHTLRDRNKEIKQQRSVLENDLV